MGSFSLRGTKKERNILKNFSMEFSTIPPSEIRNFSIIAHIDHGKSTLADRLLEKGGLLKEKKEEQVLDNMELEKERGITIKSNFASFLYSYQGKKYLFNLIDTPGHVDFQYEVLRSLRACEGVLLLIDATQGVQAQTISNFYLALEADLYILPVINKIDLPSADIPNTKRQIENILGLDPEEAVLVSAKTGEGIDTLMEKIIEKIPPPKDRREEPLEALSFDAYYDPFRGVVEKIRVFAGKIQKNDTILFLKAGVKREVQEIGISQLKFLPQESLQGGQVGYLVTGIKDIHKIYLGDTITSPHNPSSPIFPYKEMKPMLFLGIYPLSQEEYPLLKDALEKLRLNDPALFYETESNPALGAGFRVGFLGLLHAEILLERLEREFQVSILATFPSVKYQVKRKGEENYEEIENPSKIPPLGEIEEIKEPIVDIKIITPQKYLGSLLDLLKERRGKEINIQYLDPNTVEIHSKIPFAEMLYDFYDKLKSYSQGYASLDYTFYGYEKGDLVKVDILVHYERVSALSFIIHKEKAYQKAREVLKKLKEIIPRHQFQVVLQAAIGNKIIARENIPPLRKDVTAKCYGGDVTRKKKLLEKQKAGKKRMKKIGKVELPQEAFLQILKR